MKIGVVGSINIDMTIIADRIPNKGETVKGDKIMYISGGKGANQAVALARLGADVEMFGCVGDDIYGKDMIDNLIEQGVKTENIKAVENSTTGLAIITVGSNDNTIVVVAGANNFVNREYINGIKEKLLTMDTVLLQHEIPQDTVEYVIDICYKNNIKVILNPAPVRPIGHDIIDKVTYITPNEHEAEILFGLGKDINEILKRYPEKLIVTQGSKGVSTCLKSGNILSVPASKATVVDTTGAGDTLNGAFAYAISNDYDMEKALKFANIAAGLSIEKMGAQTGMPTYDAVLSRMEETK